jgi:lycopene cyclase domain-containing protein
MEFQNFWYLIILIVTGAVSFFLLVKKTNNYIIELKYMLPAIIFSGGIFTILNKRFCEAEIISFNNNYLAGTNILKLPVEEWLFLLVMSILSVTVYILVKIKFADFEKPKVFTAVNLILLLVFGLTAWFSRQKSFSFFLFFLLTIYFGYTIFRNRFKNHLMKFYLAYLISIFPFFIIKKILNTLPVIFYNFEQTLGIRIFGVYVEEFGYFFLLTLMNITIFEYLRERSLY